MMWRWLFRCMKLLFVVSTLAFIIMQINLKLLKQPPASKQHKQNPAVQPDSVANPVANPVRSDTDMGNPGYPDYDQKQFNKVIAQIHASQNTTKHVDERSSKNSRITVEEISKSIEFNNAHAEILNVETFGPTSNVQFVIVVQVHNRSRYLDMLVSSLKTARDIEKALVIFSHDFVSEEINKIVRNIKFCRVMQIFYPHSIQMYGNQFPGQDPNDCPPKITRENAKSMNCNNWEHPDKYGHYRVAKFTQIKHHWWWKLNYVVDSMECLKEYTGYFLLLEEDHFVSPDFLYVFKYMIDNKDSLCAECEMLALGVYLKSYTGYQANIGRLAIFPWFSSKHNMGMAFNRHTWNKIKNCSQLFCTYDDYNWDWSLMRVNVQCIAPRLTVLFTKAPRVFHIGEIGIHHNKFAVDKSALEVTKILDSIKDQLFPQTLTVSERSKRSLRPPKENGGWADPRDHKLCQQHGSAVTSVEP